MKIKNYFKSLLFICVWVLLQTSCDKKQTLLPPVVGTFTAQNAGSYIIATPTTTFKIPVGLTTVTNVDRTIHFTISSPTGAVAGTHYTISSNSVLIPAGKVVDSIEVKGVYNAYLSGRKDTLVFQLESKDVEASTFDNTYKLALRGPCFEQNIKLEELLGAYTNTMQSGLVTKGPYRTEIISATPISATSGLIVVRNIWNAGWRNIEFTLDWTDPANRKITLVNQATGYDAGNLNSLYNGNPMDARPLASTQTPVTGTFSYCSESLTLRFRTCFSLGCFGPTTIMMAR